jgi:hypothetical protein
MILPIAPARAPARAAPDRPPGRALVAPPRSVDARALTNDCFSHAPQARP